MKAFGYLLGMMNDGSLYEARQKHYGRKTLQLSSAYLIVLQQKEKRLADAFAVSIRPFTQNSIQRYFHLKRPTKSAWRGIKKGHPSPIHMIRVCDKRLFHWLLAFKTNPEFILQLDDENLWSYLAGAFDADGCWVKNYRTWQYQVEVVTSKRFNLVALTGLILLHFGFHPRVYARDQNPYGIHYFLRLNRQNEATRFRETAQPIKRSNWLI